MGGPKISNVRYADGTVALATSKEELQIINRRKIYELDLNKFIIEIIIDRTQNN